MDQNTSVFDDFSFFVVLGTSFSIISVLLGGPPSSLGGSDGPLGGSDGLLGGSDGLLGGSDGILGGSDGLLGVSDGTLLLLGTLLLPGTLLLRGTLLFREAFKFRIGGMRLVALIISVLGRASNSANVSSRETFKFRI